MGKAKKFKGLAKIIPAILVTAKYGNSFNTAAVNNPEELLTRKGIIAFKVNPEEKRLFLNWVESLKNQDNFTDSEIEVEFQIKGKHRTLSQNSLYWALVSVLALEVYMENGWEEVIHEELLEMYAPKVVSKLHGTSIPKRSKDLDTAEFTQLIEGVFYEINQHGVSITEPADLDQYWKNYAKIRFKGGVDHGYREDETLEEYRQRVNYCEACRKYLRPGAFGYDGHLAHIISRGSGGEDNTANILHLCANDHLFVQHQNGWVDFLKKYPHLKAKYEIAVSRHFKEK